MKKFVYLCGMMLLCMNMMAQIDLNDRNWKNVLDEQFDEDSSYWLWDHESFLNLGDHSWMGYLGGNLAPPGEYEIYQFNNCQISTIEYYKKRYVQNEDERKFLYGYFEIRCKHGEATWQGPDEMVIDHIKVYQLIWDCNKDETITCQSDLEGFEYAVKKSVTITSSTDEPIITRNNDKTTFRVTDSFEILGSFEVTSEAEFTVITQSCPTSNRTLKR